MAYSSKYTESILNNKKKKKKSYTEQVLSGEYKTLDKELKVAEVMTKDDIAPVTSSTSDLKAKRDELYNQLTNIDREEKVKWWGSGDNVFENVGNVFYKLFLETPDKKYKDNEEYANILKEYENVDEAYENSIVSQKEYSDGFMGFIEKHNDVALGNVKAGTEGISSTIGKVFGQESDGKMSIEEKYSQKALQETEGAEKVAMDLFGGIYRQVPNMLTGSTALNSALAFANFGGGAYNEAKRMGVSEERATVYGATIGGLEFALNKVLPSYKINGQNVFGKTATENIFNNAMSKISSNAFLRNTLTSGAGEFTEEYLQQFLEPILKEAILEENNEVGLLDSENVGDVVKNLTEYTIENFISKDNFYAGVLGFATAGVMGTHSNIDAYRYEKATGRSSDTGLSANEQTVLDKVVEKRIAEAETQKDGTKKQLSKKQKAEITEQAKEDLQKGYIDITDIENTLGKDITSSWKQTSEQIGELQTQLDQTTDNAQRKSIQNQIKELQKAYNQDTYLQKSYHEKSLRSKNFTYEANNDISKQKQALYESASQVMNDTTRSHEFVETVARIVEKLGTIYRFTNTKQLQEMGYKVEGKTINGLINQNGEILINVDSNKVLNQILGHETTHLLEGTKEYNKLQKIAIEYAKTKGEYDSRLSALTSLYEGTNANINNELTSDIVGDYLFTDKAFVEQLATKEPNVFQKIYNRIKELVELVTSNKEKRQLIELKRTFEEALNNAKKNSVETTNKQVVEQTKDNSTTEALSNTQKIENTPKEDKVGEKISQTEQKTEVQEDIAPVKEEVKTEIVVSDKTDNLGRTLTEAQLEFFKDSKVRDENGNLLTMYHGTSGGGFTAFDPYASSIGLFGQGSYFTDNKSVAESYTEKGKGNNKQVYEVYLNITNPIDMDAQGDVEAWTKAFSGMDGDIGRFLESGTNEQIYRSALEYFDDGNEYDKYEISGMMIEAIEKMGYDGITHIGGGRFNKKDDTRHRVYIALESNQVKNVDNTNPTSEADIRYSLSESTTDNKGRELSKAQQEFFKDSKVRDDNGNLKVLYHGSNSEFTIFDINKGGASSKEASVGFWFTESEKGAKNFAGEIWYGNVRDENGRLIPQVYETYLNIKNPKIYEKIENEELKQQYKNEAKELEEQAHAINSRYFWSETGDYQITSTFDTFKRDLKYNDTSVNPFALAKEKGISEQKAKEMLNDAKKYHELNKQAKQKENEYNKLRYNDSYEQFKTDIYEIAGMGAEDANFGGIGMMLDNENEVMKQFRQKLIDEGYDGIVIKNTSFDTDALGAGNNQYVAFYPEQIKNVDNLNPTENEDIRYSLSEDNQKIVYTDKKGKQYTYDELQKFLKKKWSSEDTKDRKLSKKQQVFFKDSKARNGMGQLKTVYHTMTDRGLQFNEFNPVGTDYYRFGEQVVNYFTDSKDMSGSYANQRYLKA